VDIRDILAVAPVVPVVAITDAEQAVPLARALAAGGLRVLEIATRGPVAFAAIEAIRKAMPETIVGIGTLTRAVEFAAAARVGAQFGVTPGLTPELASAARGARFPLLPGIMTPTEVVAARSAGFDTLRLCPAQASGGIGMLQALTTWFPDVQFCPSGGIGRDAVRDYLALPNVVCVGSNWMAPPDLIEHQDWVGIQALAREAAALRRNP
jgi:2-dehydro-3-deoxyphosphogluconate aldolase/(4S)-4-hydroxy-2-oxoglutarate aldolase